MCGESMYKWSLHDSPLCAMYTGVQTMWHSTHECQLNRFPGSGHFMPDVPAIERLRRARKAYVHESQLVCYFTHLSHISHICHIPSSHIYVTYLTHLSHVSHICHMFNTYICQKFHAIVTYLFHASVTCFIHYICHIIHTSVTYSSHMLHILHICHLFHTYVTKQSHHTGWANSKSI